MEASGMRMTILLAQFMLLLIFPFYILKKTFYSVTFKARSPCISVQLRLLLTLCLGALDTKGHMCLIDPQSHT